MQNISIKILYNYKSKRQNYGMLKWTVKGYIWIVCIIYILKILCKSKYMLIERISLNVNQYLPESEQQWPRGSIAGLATWIFRDWLSAASKSRHGWTPTNQPTNLPESNALLFLPGSNPWHCLGLVYTWTKERLWKLWISQETAQASWWCDKMNDTELCLKQLYNVQINTIILLCGNTTMIF